MTLLEYKLGIVSAIIRHGCKGESRSLKKDPHVLPTSDHGNYGPSEIMGAMMS